MSISNRGRVAVKRNRLLTSVLAMVLVMTFFAAAEALGQAAPPAEGIDPANFVSPAEAAANPNQFFPLIPGTKYFYEGESDGEPTSNVVFVTRDTKPIQGVNTTVVHDQVFENGKLVEDTSDWYAQDKDGNVWYFGEDSKDLDPDTGEVISTEGSWEAGQPVPPPGTGIAQPGIIMEANPQVGDRYYQEFAPGVAEDQAQVLDLDAQLDECVPYGCFEDLLQTKEWTELEPGVVEHKYYADCVGFIFGEMVKGGEENDELVNITGPGRKCGGGAGGTGGGAELTQEGEQQAESGDIDQSVNVS
jgi:hypothetical protein